MICGDLDMPDVIMSVILPPTKVLLKPPCLPLFLLDCWFSILLCFVVLFLLGGE
jgi:hypothetical protein